MLVLMRSTNGCNMRCAYCYGDYTDNQGGIEPEDCARLLETLKKENIQGKRVEFLWHGGEPGLLEIDKFENMVNLLNGLGEAGVEVSHSLQSNGLAMKGKWLPLLREHHIAVGISMDGPPELHDRVRKLPDGTGSYANIHGNVQALRKAGVKISLLCTLGPQHMGREEEMVGWLQEIDLPIKFNPLFAKGRSGERLPLRSYYASLRNIFQLLLKAGSAPPVQPLEWMLRSILYDAPPGECSFGGSCGRNIFSFGKNCEIGICTRDPEVYGSLRTSSLAAIRSQPGWVERTGRNRNLPRCKNCEARPYCNGGCPAIWEGLPDAEDCAAIREFFAWLKTVGLDLYRDALVERKKALSLTLEAMKKLQTMLAQNDV